VLDELNDFPGRCNSSMVGLERIIDEEEAECVRLLIKKHADCTGSQRAFKILAFWEEMVPRFVKVMPRDYKRVVQAIKKAYQAGLSGDAALNAAFEENSTDGARVGGG